MPTIARNQKLQRHGAIIPFVAVLLPIFFIMVAFAIDFGVISVSKQQLQNAADAGALAALVAYQNNPSDGDQAAFETLTAHNFLGNDLEFDVFQSISYGQFNAETNQFIEIPREGGNSGTIADGETIPQGAQAVRVQLIRSAENGNAVNLFFAPFIGVERATVVAEAIAGGSTSCGGFIGIESATILNNITTDSYNSDLGPYDSSSNRNENGGICSSGDIFLASGADVFGDAYGNVEIAQGSDAHVHGTINGPETFDLEPNPAPSSNDNDTIARGPVWAPPFYDESTQDLVINNGRNLTLQAGTYHFRDLLLQGGSQLIIDGEVEIFIDREMRFDNGTVANLGQLPKDFILNVNQGPVNIQGGHNLHAVIYAPEADLFIQNDGGFFGALTAKTLELGGGAQLHYDESLRDDDGASGAPRLVF